MKNIVLYLLLLVSLLGNFSCANKGTSDKNKIDPDDTIPGRKVMVMNADSTPKVVYYYRVDDNGRMTDERVREIHYFPGKKKYVEGTLKNNRRDGVWKAYFENGYVNTDAFYVDGKKHGDYKVYQENGSLLYAGHYNMGICDGVWIFYDDAGKEERKITADSNTVVCGGCEKCREIRKRNQ